MEKNIYHKTQPELPNFYVELEHEHIDPICMCMSTLAFKLF